MVLSSLYSLLLRLLGLVTGNPIPNQAIAAIASDHGHMHGLGKTIIRCFSEV